MKKILSYAFIALLGIGASTSCSEDEPVIRCFLMGIASSGTTSTYTYNDKNRVSTAVSGSSVSIYTYDAQGRISTVTGSGYSETWTYDGSGRLAQKLTTYSGSDVYTSTYSYNESGQLTTIVNVVPNCPTCGSTTTFSYPNTGTRNYSQVVYADGGSYSYEYDTKINPYSVLFPEDPSVQTNNITKSTYSGSGSTAVTLYTYAYNEHGYPITRTAAGGSSGVWITTYICK